ncbi:hypothetical protein BKA62DRAFT_697813 [Auriculariales sp. MPI-PUGE-AT-0066]|nr:hypothetical protein BKA62DRAFT_697813 [Auriculariales sp. MPI-PUGE-AT-0066]
MSPGEISTSFTCTLNGASVSISARDTHASIPNVSMACWRYRLGSKLPWNSSLLSSSRPASRYLRLSGFGCGPRHQLPLVSSSAIEPIRGVKSSSTTGPSSMDSVTLQRLMLFGLGFGPRHQSPLSSSSAMLPIRGVGSSSSSSRRAALVCPVKRLHELRVASGGDLHLVDTVGLGGRRRARLDHEEEPRFLLVFFELGGNVVADFVVELDDAGKARCGRIGKVAIEDGGRSARRRHRARAEAAGEIIVAVLVGRARVAEAERGEGTLEHDDRGWNETGVLQCKGRQTRGMLAARVSDHGALL